MPDTVWILYDNEPGMPGRVMGVSSRDSLARECSVIQAECGGTGWEKRQESLYLCIPPNKEEYFSLELATVDRLADSQ